MDRLVRTCRSVGFSVISMSCFLTGCDDLAGPTQSDRPARPKTTDQIGEFDPAAGLETVPARVVITNPITGPLEAYQPLRQKIAGLGIEHAVNLFQASEGRYPKDHDEFMSRVIKENNMRLPELPAGLSYQYDVQNHKLVVVRTATGAPVE